MSAHVLPFSLRTVRNTVSRLFSSASRDEYSSATCALSCATRRYITSGETSLFMMSHSGASMGSDLMLSAKASFSLPGSKSASAPNTSPHSMSKNSSPRRSNALSTRIRAQPGPLWESSRRVSESAAGSMPLSRKNAATDSPSPVLTRPSDTERG